MRSKFFIFLEEMEDLQCVTWGDVKSRFVFTVCDHWINGNKLRLEQSCANSFLVLINPRRYHVKQDLIRLFV